MYNTVLYNSVVLPIVSTLYVMLKFESDMYVLKLELKPWISRCVHFQTFVSVRCKVLYVMYSHNLIHIYFKIVVHEGDSINI